jgi:hypothetical protein
MAQEKFGTLFCVCAQKILDENSALACSNFLGEKGSPEQKNLVRPQPGHPFGRGVAGCCSGTATREKVRQPAVLPESRGDTYNENS